MSSHLQIPLQPVMKLCKDCVFAKGANSPGYVSHCTAVVDPIRGLSVLVREARSGPLCGPSGNLFVRKELCQ